jgi:hypothetical protein
VWLAQNTAGSYVQGMLDHFACTRVGQKKGNIIGAGRTLQQQQPSAQGATSSSNGTSAGAGPSAPAAPSTSSNGINQTTSDSSSQVAAVPVQSAAYDQSAQQQPQQQQQQAAATPKLPPGFAAVHYQGRPCQLMMLRGFCPMGDKCPYDHPPRAGLCQPVHQE